jgi:hypothetical protein
MKNFNKTTDDVMDMIWNIAASKKKIVPPTAVETLEDFFIIFGRKLLVSLFLSIRNIKNKQEDCSFEVIEVHKNKINVNFFLRNKVISHIYPMITFHNNGIIVIKDEEELIPNCIIEGNSLYIGHKSPDNYVHDKVDKIISKLERVLTIKSSKVVEQEEKIIKKFPKIIKPKVSIEYEYKLRS